jgi:glutamine phosphoribosylpyrophosphate amidotransferase
MCGIFGVYSANANIDKDVLKEVAVRNSFRGNRGLGILQHSDQVVVNRYASVNENWHEDITDVSDVVLGHTVAPTGTSHIVHPIETERFIFAHNGILLNYKEYPQWGWLDNKLDSAYLLCGIIDSLVDNVADSIVKTAEQFKGQQSCWLYDKNTNELYVWRVMSTLFYGAHNDAIWFSSTNDIKAFQLKNAFNEGIVYKLKREFERFDEVSAFVYENIYDMGRK